ncbi:hypothetical protein ACH5RR_012532 [Cinchona calisaya]|uniref:Uncharacterized protein n=1 Tax=Cinchona calisaya TaxID=153742 RepID=A0ABD3AAE9_9GENT
MDYSRDIANSGGFYSTKLDARTANSERGRYARLCIQLDLSKPLRPLVRLGKHLQDIQYADISLCFVYGMFGHTKGNCVASNQQQDEQSPPATIVNPSHTLKAPNDSFGLWMIVSSHSKQTKGKQVQSSQLKLHNKFSKLDYRTTQKNQVNSLPKKEWRQKDKENKHVTGDLLGQNSNFQNFEIGSSSKTRELAEFLPSGSLKSPNSQPPANGRGADHGNAPLVEQAGITDLHHGNLSRQSQLAIITPSPKDSENQKLMDFSTEQQNCKAGEIARSKSKVYHPPKNRHTRKGSFCLSTNSTLARITIQNHAYSSKTRSNRMQTVDKDNSRRHKLINAICIDLLSKDEKSDDTNLLCSQMSQNMVPQEMTSLMKIFMWNVGGAGSSNFRQHLLKYINIHKPRIVILTKTKLSGSNANEACSILLFSHAEIVDAQGFKGGI